jgi:hypothetical protein
MKSFSSDLQKLRWKLILFSFDKVLRNLKREEKKTIRSRKNGNWND